jgi:uncharacterized protein (TIGR03435 family)
MRFLAGWLMALAAWGQVFDAAEVRVYKPGPGGPPVQVLIDGVPTAIQPNPGGVAHIAERPFAPSGSVTLRYVTMRALITLAYKEAIRGDWVMGGPGWLDSDYFDLIGKAPPGTPMDAERLMIQAVLAERFHLAVHREQKPMPVFVLTVGKGAPKFKPATGSEDSGCDGARSVQGLTHSVCQNVTMAQLAKELPDMDPARLDRYVLDLTGISGSYDFQLDWSPRRSSDAGPGLTIFDALDKLGLKLEERRQPMTVIVVDHVDRVPTEN